MRKPEELLREIRDQLAAQADPADREGVQRYFQHTVKAWGVRAPEVRRIGRPVYAEIKTWPITRRDRLAALLWKGGTLEEGALAIVLYQRFHREFGEREFALFERWIDRWVSNWAACDGVSACLVAAAIANCPGLVGRLASWAGSKNRWKRRAAAVSLIWEARRGRHLADILAVAELLLPDEDDMVRKGVGWLLKDAYPQKPREIVGFLAPRKAGVPRLVLRIAAEKMTATDRTMIIAR